MFASSHVSGILPRFSRFTLQTIMKLFALFSLFASIALADAARINPKDAAQLVADGKAILIDVREPKEWAQTGVAEPARLLSKSDFDGEQKEWKPFLATVGDRQLILYCHSGRRAGVVAEALNKLGYKASNAGGLADWKKSGLPTRSVKDAASK